MVQALWQLGFALALSKCGLSALLLTGSSALDDTFTKIVMMPPLVFSNSSTASVHRRSLHHRQEAFCPTGMIPMASAGVCMHHGQPASPQKVQIVKQIVKETSCPQGMVLEGHKCIGQQICPPRLICPPTSPMTNDGSCLSVLAPQITCPPPYTLEPTTGSCIAMDMAPPALTCPQPFSLDASTGSCVSSVPSPPVCPPGTLSRGSQQGRGGCYARLPPLQRCPLGTTPNRLGGSEGASCVAIRREPASVVCPEGAFPTGPDGGGVGCAVSQQPPPFCPPGFHFSQNSDGVCIQAVPQQAAPCPMGGRPILGSRECEMVENYPADVVCPDGFALQDQEPPACQRDRELPPECPRGFSVNERGDACERLVGREPVCPDGSQQMLAKNMGRVPHQNYDSSAMCRRLVPLPMKVCCPPGFELVNDQHCRRVEQLAPLMSYEGECVTVTSYPPSFLCPPDFPDLPNNQQIAAFDGGPTPPAECRRGERENLQFSAVPASKYCPQGGELEEGEQRCVLRVPIPIKMRCEIGVLDEISGTCIRELVVPAKSICPTGSRRRGMECLTEELMPADFVCPEGSQKTERNGAPCVVTASLSYRPNQIERIPAQRRCQGPATILKGDVCILPTRIPQEMRCPDGFEFAGVQSGVGSGMGAPPCVRSAPMVIPPAVERRVKPCFVCPNPSMHKEGSECIETMRVPMEKECPNGYEWGDGCCVQEVQPVCPPPRVVLKAPVAVCPPPMQLVGPSCISRRTVSALMICPPSYQLVNGKCIQRTQPMPVCPKSMQLTPQGCTKIVKAKPKTRLVKGCTHNKPCPLCSTPVMQSTCL